MKIPVRHLSYDDFVKGMKGLCISDMFSIREKALVELIDKWYPTLSLKESIVLRTVVNTYETISPHTSEIVARVSDYFPELFRNKKEIKNTIALLVSN